MEFLSNVSFKLKTEFVYFSFYREDLDNMLYE